jgi:hypothetical protein
MAHEVTTSTKTHQGEEWGAGRYREPAAKARAEVISGEIIGAAIEVHRQLRASFVLVVTSWAIFLSQGSTHLNQAGGGGPYTIGPML